MLSPEELQALGRRVGQLRRASGLTQRRLAAAAGVSHAYIALLEHGRLPSPGTFRLEAVAHSLGLSSAQVLLEPDSAVAAAPGRACSGLLPVYPWGAPADPRSPDRPPDPDHLEPAPVGRETLVGPNGFGLLANGDGLAARGISDGDVVWVNPDRPLYPGKLVVALEPSAGLVVTDYGRDQHTSIGPVVGITSWRLPR